MPPCEPSICLLKPAASDTSDEGDNAAAATDQATSEHASASRLSFAGAVDAAVAAAQLHDSSDGTDVAHDSDTHDDDSDDHLVEASGLSITEVRAAAVPA